MRVLLPFATALLLTACAAAPGATPTPRAPAATAAATVGLPQTRPERTAYRETSRYADVVQFLDSLRALGAPIRLGTLGTSPEGRPIPYAIASRPLLRTPQEARAAGRPVVYVQGNIHGGEVEGKEALQALLRDLVFEDRPNVLDSIVLIAVPIYNIDGNERFGPQALQRSEQHGPELVGQRANGQGLDLNRDYMKAVAPETLGSLAMFNYWDPDVFVDLHATNGSYHGYDLTYAPSLSPAAGEAGRLTRDELLPELRRRMRDRHGLESFDYGNFARVYGADATPDTTREAWYTYDHRPRFGTNYYGLRGRVSILSEAYSHDPFEHRIAVTDAFVREILSLGAERADALARLRRTEPLAALGGEVPLRAEMTRSPYIGEVVMELLVADPDSTPAEPGVHPGIRRTGEFRTLRIPVYDRFDATHHRRPPAAYALAPSDTGAVRLLEQHGVRVERLALPAEVRAEVFTMDSVIRSPRPFQGHHELRLEGRWRPEQRTLPAGSFVVPVDQWLGVVATYLLEPESADGIATWSSPAAGQPARRYFERELREGEEFPVLRLTG
jgi:hypothetical protein